MLSRFPAKVVLVFIVAMLLLTLGFYRNQWGAAGKKYFYDWKTNNELMLVARLVWSRQTNVFSEGALFGVGDSQWPLEAGAEQRQYEIYLNNGKFNTYATYNSAIGAQGVVFGLIDKLTSFDPGINLKLFHGISAVFSAIALAALICWFLTEFGYLPALFVLGFALMSEWLTLYGASIFFQLWSFYAPMLGILFYLSKVNVENEINYRSLALVSVFTVIVKGLFSGFEFIIVALAMMIVPTVYYFVLRKWRLKTIFAICGNIAVSALAGTMICLTILSFQISSVTGSWGKAISYIIFTFGKRSFGDPANYSGFEAASLTSNFWSVLYRYVYEGRAINLGNLIQSNIPWIQDHLEIGYDKLFILFAFVSLIFFIVSRRNKQSLLYHKTLSLLYATWFSVLAPLSWFVLFKAHAYIHAQLDYIVWQMPFTLFGFALCGMTINYLVSLLKFNSR